MKRQNQKQQRERLETLASDLCKLYIRFVEEHSNPLTATIDDFQLLFDECKTEYLHYVGPSTASCPYHPDVVEDLLQLAVAYLYIPSAIATGHVRRFGFFIVYFLYATQPAHRVLLRSTQEEAMGGTTVSPTPVYVSAFILEQAMQLVEDKKQQPFCLSGHLHPCGSDPSSPVSAGGGSIPRYRGASPTANQNRPLPISPVEEQIIVSMHLNRAWCVQPYVDITMYLQAILNTHETQHVPLLKPVLASNPVHDSGYGGQRESSIPAALMRGLSDYAAMKTQLNF